MFITDSQVLGKLLDQRPHFGTTGVKFIMALLPFDSVTYFHLSLSAFD